MKITAVKCLLLSAPYAVPGDLEREFCFADGHRTISVIKVETDEGLYGLGETYIGVFAPEATQAIVKQLEIDLIGRDPTDIAGIAGILKLAIYYWGRFGMSASIAGGIEMALWDLKGKALGVPVHQLLGGKVHDHIPAYASGGNNKPFPELKEELLGYQKLGYGAVKIRINYLEPREIVEKVAYSREVLGKDTGLGVDACQGVNPKAWNYKEAISIVRSLEPCNLLFVEEPCEVTDYKGFAKIRAGTDCIIAGGETVSSLPEAENYLDAGALDLFQPDAALIGGISAFRRIAQMCERKFIKIAVHTWAGGVGIMGNYHAAFASPNCTILELPNNPFPLREEFLVKPLTLVNGGIEAPTAPGLGVKLPEDVEKRYPYRPGSFYSTVGYPKRNLAAPKK
ncbi:MAG: mandelate racemase/muconate lactonizing enzyme family protein [Opitutaceae bacterium]|jgi:L-alanine-DL-glutamate epimerase-like enolase superfamily enzyme|nr:mandelate racemase/muconate lactonizing enzyme family protein [Opitutaceae bacterium]